MSTALHDHESDLERELRAALARRAAAYSPRLRDVPVGEPPGPGVGRRVLLPVAAVVLPVALLVAAVLALRSGDDAEQVPAAPGGEVPYLVVELPGGAAGLVEEGMSPVPVNDPVNPQQSFRRPGRFDGPMVFVTTVNDLGSFGLVSPGEDVVEVTVRGEQGLLARYSGADGAATLSVVLGDGPALYVNAVGLGDAELVAFVDGLVEGEDGSWQAPDGDLVEVPAAAPEDGSTWEVQGVGAEVGYELSLRSGTFESWLRDRVASTAGPVEQVEVAGVPAAVGPYSPTDWWVLFEPAPGRTVEVRIAGDRAAVDQVLAAVRPVDEATWRGEVGG
jgi:hypothetical protein